MLQHMHKALMAAQRLQEPLLTLAIAVGGLLMLGACLYRVTVLQSLSAGQAMEVLWPAYLAGVLSLLLGWLADRWAS